MRRSVAFAATISFDRTLRSRRLFGQEAPRAFFFSLAASAMFLKKPVERSIGPERPAQ